MDHPAVPSAPWTIGTRRTWTLVITQGVPDDDASEPGERSSATTGFVGRRYLDR